MRAALPLVCLNLGRAIAVSVVRGNRSQNAVSHESLGACSAHHTHALESSAEAALPAGADDGRRTAAPVSTRPSGAEDRSSPESSSLGRLHDGDVRPQWT